MKMMTARATTLLVSLGALFTGQVSAVEGAERSGAARDVVRGAVAQEESDEDIYRTAREAITRGQFDRARELLGVLRERFPSTRYAPEALYWQAFSAYRLESMREALALLERQLETHPEARISDDSRDLELRIRALLGSRGDSRSAERALREAELALGATTRLADMSAAERSTMMAEQAILRTRMAMEIAAARATVTGGSWQEACEEDDIRHAAIQALMQMDSDRAIPLLRTVLRRRDECSVPLRKQAIFVMSQHDPAQVEDLMVEVARTDPDPGVKEAAVFWLSQVGTESALEALSDILRNTDEPGLQENAIFALAQHPSGRAADVLKAYALDSSKPERVREKAIFWLGQQREVDPQLLIDLYGQLGSPGLKEQVFMSLSQGDDDRSTGWILERALDQSEDIELRKQALFWAGQRSSVNLDRLQGLYARLTDPEMKEQLIFLYAHRPEEAAVDRLIEIARSEEDTELRKKAIFWLGQTRDERAIAFLLELVGDPL